jgi:hypothetical protein
MMEFNWLDRMHELVGYLKGLALADNASEYLKRCTNLQLKSVHLVYIDYALLDHGGYEDLLPPHLREHMYTDLNPKQSHSLHEEIVRPGSDERGPAVSPRVERVTG